MVRRAGDAEETLVCRYPSRLFSVGRYLQTLSANSPQSATGRNRAEKYPEGAARANLPHQQSAVGGQDRGIASLLHHSISEVSISEKLLFRMGTRQYSQTRDEISRHSSINRPIL